MGAKYVHVLVRNTAGTDFWPCIYVFESYKDARAEMDKQVMERCAKMDGLKGFRFVPMNWAARIITDEYTINWSIRRKKVK